MRLIDLDDDRHTYCGDNGEYERWSIDPDVPVVDAIPIEWLIEKYQIVGMSGTETYFKKAYAVHEIIKDWRRENDTR